ncbi:MAG TPA: methylmalonyl-CoA mutase family protein [candidate division Zixibacteria bacterium]|nr:methylmalonyl-CoA mutase family protein [candidate division Zixibacteria bacterium]MDD4916263.1 methylmalonyl-CoA mutase family protein [candidate division Zixibacteria bacterium]MDM7973139.1 methylmalonyl-CoA mutase family protein [candidate division Zixibacteria bacterium]HOD66577.1 methylmalonyl-CoA mutase family protein [candidate division Zixibacteria bacterium]HOZ08036.1 methylmalonyl-CoA mutase family protein [candidate division Zixibacteria bacterium]
MFLKKFLDQLKAHRQTWDQTAEKYRAQKSMPRFFTVSGVDINDLYTPDSIAGADREDYFWRNLGFPGEYPYTRGVHHTLYRTKLWTMRQFAGMGTPRQTNERFHYILANGGTGLSTAFDLPTLMGYDSDHPRSLGEVGKCGVAVDTLADMEIIFDRIDLGRVSTSMTINSPASMILAMYLAVAEKQGVPFAAVTGTLQNDILKEYIAQKEFIFPPRPSLRLITDMIAYCTRHVSKFNTISISGYHIREAGSTAVQELAFTLADGFQYVDSCLEAGMGVDEFAPRLSFFFNAHSDFFEEIAKYRAARRIWARHLRERYRAQDERSWKLRFHTQTAGVSLTAQQPENNIARVAIQGLSAVLGGTQSLHTNSMDETLALPSEKAARIALRTQQIIAYETGVANTIDPLAGSYFVEALTDQMEAGAEAYFREIAERGGVLKCIEDGFFQQEIARAAYAHQQELERDERVIVGVNRFQLENEEIDIPVLRIDPQIERDQVAFLKKVKAERDRARVEASLETLRRVARGQGNTFEALLECARAYASVGEMCDVLRQEWGEWVESQAAMMPS